MLVTRNNTPFAIHFQQKYHQHKHTYFCWFSHTMQSQNGKMANEQDKKMWAPHLNDMYKYLYTYYNENNNWGHTKTNFNSMSFEHPATGIPESSFWKEFLQSPMMIIIIIKCECAFGIFFVCKRRKKGGHHYNLPWIFFSLKNLI